MIEQIIVQDGQEDQCQNEGEQPLEVLANKTHVIHFSPEIGPTSVGALIQCTEMLVTRGALHICLAISSNGGSVKDGIEAHNYLRGLPIKLTTHNMGIVGSAANMLFFAADERATAKNGSFMLHGTSLSLGSDMSLGKESLQKLSAQREHFDEQTAITIAGAKGVKLTKKKILDIKGDRHIGALEAKDLGLVQKIAALRRQKLARFIHITSIVTGG